MEMINLMAEIICSRLIRLHLLLDFAELEIGIVSDEDEFKS
jgi:hypothetical protein